MNLTLEIVSANGAALGPARRKIFGPEGGRIGRSPDCDWVLANPYVSRHHATIRWISGTYYIESTGENGVAIGTAQAIIPKLERRPLRHGDHIFIDEYEAVVGLDSVVAEPPGIPSDPLGIGADPLGAVDPLRIAGDPLGTAADPLGVADPRAVGGPLIPESAGAGVFAPSDDPFDLDPLKHLGGRGASPVTAPRQESSWNHTPGVSDHFAAPSVAPSAPLIPDDWDKTSFSQKTSGPALAPGAPSAPGPASAPPPRRPAAAPQAAPSPPAVPRGVPAAPPRPAPTAPSRVAPAAPAAAARPATPGGASPSRAAAGAPVSGSGVAGRPLPGSPAPGNSAPGSPAPGSPVRGGPATQGFDVDAFLASAGVDPASVAPETAGELGRILRSVVQGLIDILRARAEIKEQFRLAQTIVKTAENNPLKFAVNAEDALGSLLGRRNSAYLPPVEAFEDAFDDIRFHQLAMLAGMRAGFDHVMNRFDPQQLQERFEKGSRRGGLLPMSGKSRYWEQFVEDFQGLAGDRELAFRRLFAEEFATAYEKQLEVLKRSQAKVRR